MRQMVDAAFERGVFRPLTPVVDVSDHASVRLIVETEVRRRTPVSDPSDDIEAHIAEIKQLGEVAFGCLTPIEELALREARLDQQQFFSRPTP